MGSPPLVRIVVDHEVLREVVLRPPMTFGRASDNDIVLDDEAVSAHHGRIERVLGRWRYLDCGSANGTRVAGGRRLGPEERMDLEDGCQLMLGDTILDFRLGEPAPAATGDIEATLETGAGDEAVIDALDRMSQDPASVPAGGGGPAASRAAPDDDAPPVERSPRVVVVTADDVSTHFLHGGRAVLGRAPDCDVVVDEPSVSAHHAELVWSGTRWVVRDLGSTNGTRVGLAPVVTERPLVHAAHLILGEVDLMFVQDDADGPSADDLVRRLRRSGHLDRQAAKASLDAHARSHRSIEEILLEGRHLSPGRLHELRHDALSAASEREGRESGLVGWVLMVLAVSAIVWLLLR